ncbi:hypothetical protein MRK42_14635 [Aeromonas sp. 19NY04SH05-1]|uniref:Uncharacterized protein n=1 Tax=Aeromonas sp. 19NY04SH05-1 TaxID=2920537 RepID=A0AAU6T597_9GAMM|nr:hypothetical protein [Aeromonas schubertii]MBZ6073105.1 hypothetical protein [Aeromonas schubertii]
MMEVTQEWLLENWNRLHYECARPIWSDEQRDQIIGRILNTFSSNKITIKRMPNWLGKGKSDAEQDEIILTMLVRLGSPGSPSLYGYPAEDVLKGHRKKFKPSNSVPATKLSTAIEATKELEDSLVGWIESGRNYPLFSAGGVEFTDPTSLIESVRDVLAAMESNQWLITERRRVLGSCINGARHVFRGYGIPCSDGTNSDTAWMEILACLWGCEDGAIRQAWRKITRQPQ